MYAALLAVVLAVATGDVREVVLERGPCLGSCPVYRVAIRADGSATYTGWRFAERTGVHVATFDPADFERIAELIARVGFHDMRASYLAPINDLPVVRTTVRRRDGTARTIQDHGRVGVGEVEGPPGLLRVQDAIDDLVAGLEWRQESESPGPYIPGVY